MAAELAYAQKVQRVRTHLDATRRLAGGLGRTADTYHVQVLCHLFFLLSFCN